MSNSELITKALAIADLLHTQENFGSVNLPYIDHLLQAANTTIRQLVKELVNAKQIQTQTPKPVTKQMPALKELALRVAAVRVATCTTCGQTTTLRTHSKCYCGGTFQEIKQ